ncbi:MAG: hypothetical protein RTU30_11165 [Candidatus Thorarchaeota archaeon]
MIEISKRNAAICGVFSPIVVIVTIAITTVIAASWFDWTVNALSDLGHPYMIGGSSGTPGSNPTAPIFNTGIFTAGLLVTIFTYSLYRNRVGSANTLEKIGYIGLLLASVTLIGVGVFNESIFLPHAICAITFFFSFMIASLAWGLGVVRKGELVTLGWVSIAMGIVTIFTMVGLPLIFSVTISIASAIHEAAMFVPGFVWVVVFAVQIISEQTTGQKS